MFKFIFILSIILLNPFLLIGEEDSHHDHKSHQVESKKDLNESSHDDHEEDSHSEGLKEVHLTEEQLKSSGIIFEKPQRRKIKKKITLLGEVKLDKTLLVHVFPLVSAIAKKVLKREGQKVEDNEALAYLESSELGEAKLKYLTALFKDRLAQTQHKRNQRIFQNTKALFSILEKYPSLKNVRKKIKDLKIGANKGILLKAYSDLNFSKKNLEREKRLFEDKVSSDRSFQEATRDFEKSEVQYYSAFEEIKYNSLKLFQSSETSLQIADNSLHSAKERLRLLGVDQDKILGLDEFHGQDERHHWHTTKETRNDESQADFKSLGEYILRAPAEGVLLERHLSKGERISRETQAFLIADTSRVWVDFSIYATDLGKIHKGQKVRVFSEEHQVEAWGKVDFVSLLLDRDSRQAICRVILENPNRLWKPGMFVNGELSIPSKERVLAVPRKAIFQDDKHSYLFVKKEEEIQVREVELGKRDFNWAEIIKGLDPAESFAVNRVFLLKSELQKETLSEAGHSH